MKEKIFINARIIDPSQNMDEKGSLILNDNGKVKAIGKNVKKSDTSSNTEIVDVNTDLGIIQTKDPLNSNEEFGSALTYMDGKLLGIAMPSTDMNYFLSSKI